MTDVTLWQVSVYYADCDYAGNEQHEWRKSNRWKEYNDEYRGSANGTESRSMVKYLTVFRVYVMLMLITRKFRVLSIIFVANYATDWRWYENNCDTEEELAVEIFFLFELNEWIFFVCFRFNDP